MNRARERLLFLIFGTLIASLIGCGGEEITIGDVVDIYVSESELGNDWYPVTILVAGELPDSCAKHDLTRYIRRNDIDGYPLYKDGETIYIPMYASVGFGICTQATHFYYEAIFLGFFEPGDYVLDINRYPKKFRVTKEGNVTFTLETGEEQIYEAAGN